MSLGQVNQGCERHFAFTRSSLTPRNTSTPPVPQVGKNLDTLGEDLIEEIDDDLEAPVKSDKVFCRSYLLHLTFLPTIPL